MSICLKFFITPQKITMEKHHFPFLLNDFEKQFVPFEQNVVPTLQLIEGVNENVQQIDPK